MNFFPMNKQARVFLWVLALPVLYVLVMGCSKDRDLERINQEQAATIKALNNEISRLNDQMDRLSPSERQAARANAGMQRRMMAVSK